MIVKYLRVSTSKQDPGRQEMQLDKLGIKFDKEYIDKMTHLFTNCSIMSIKYLRLLPSLDILSQ